MIRGRTGWLALWVGLCLACGDIAGTYLAAVGIGGILAGRASRRRGAALLAVGALWFVLVSLLGGGQGSNFVDHYGYLAGSSGTGHLGVGAWPVASSFTHCGWRVSCGRPTPTCGPTP